MSYGARLVRGLVLAAAQQVGGPEQVGVGAQLADRSGEGSRARRAPGGRCTPSWPPPRQTGGSPSHSCESGPGRPGGRTAACEQPVRKGRRVPQRQRGPGVGSSGIMPVSRCQAGTSSGICSSSRALASPAVGRVFAPSRHPCWKAGQVLADLMTRLVFFPCLQDERNVARLARLLPCSTWPRHRGPVRRGDALEPGSPVRPVAHALHLPLPVLPAKKAPPHVPRNCVSPPRGLPRSDADWMLSFRITVAATPYLWPNSAAGPGPVLRWIKAVAAGT